MLGTIPRASSEGGRSVTYKKWRDSHPSDQELLQAADGELSEKRTKAIEAHLTACWPCRARAREFEDTITSYLRAHYQTHDRLCSSDGESRALLRSRIAGLDARSPGRQWIFQVASVSLAIVFIGIFAFALNRWMEKKLSPVAHMQPIAVPNGTLTPGAAAIVTREQVCGGTLDKNRKVQTALQRRVFAAYGISGADPRAYEVDYLITPALGGSDDIRNLWPHSYSATTWNARVKDELEDRLHQMVCDGQLDLTTAQREIAGNWIGAYKKYLHTERPLDIRR